ncbi:hypothetical protein QYE76_054637 [Lolium multiflorum]|uniref:Protein kinase domain-containing protein n=1 Tax=Lolium multiflorum TaxID=4521 RepID=A0AAD8SY32_LOLMU|nr:hypothetical protein QYE76_054637 [Lolium multiflorum]
MAALATGLGVAQLVLWVGKIILKITQEADKVRRKKQDCAYLVRYLSVIHKMLPTLPEDPELELPLNHLYSTLQEADKLVVACIGRLSFLRCRSDAFRDVNAKITSDLSLFPLAFYTAVARRRAEESILPDRQDSGALTEGSSSSGSTSTHAHASLVSDYHPRARPSRLTWAEVEEATENLAYLLGEGFSGKVYQGRLHRGGRVREVAVKVLNEHGHQGMEDAFVAELETLYPLHHSHIARLVAWCSEWERPIFVYDHMGNGTLRDHLSGLLGSSSPSPVASSWKTRLEALLGVSRALLHLHREAERPVIHRNVTSSNILLDASWKSHLSDFGVAVLRAAGDQGQPVEEVVGTFGYIDPEYSRTRRVSSASDVYSLGVVMLEVLTGRPPVSPGLVTLVSSTLPVIQNGDLRNVLDGRPALGTTPRQLEALQNVADTAVLCLWPRGGDRPPMSKVVDNLEQALVIIRSDET